jgi:hypothetical protein
MDDAPTWRRLAMVLGMVLLSTGALGTRGEAGELGHYVPSLFNVRDFVMPPKGVYVALYSLYYTSDEFRDRHGNEVNSVTIRQRTLDLDVDLDLYSLAPAVLWNTGFKILGADYGMIGALPFGGPSVQASLALGPDLGIEADESAFGLQDLLVQPLWLGWHLPNADLALAYAFYAPSGRFKQGDPDNLGLGFWTHQFQLGGAYYLLKRATALVMALTYEIHMNKEDVDILPGSDLSFNYGVSQFLPAGPGLLELGVLGYSQWQVTDDDGADARNPDVHDQVHTIGGQLGYALPKWHLGITMKYLYEYYAEDRFRGQALTWSIGYQF